MIVLNRRLFAFYKREYASEEHYLTNIAPFKNLRIPLLEKLKTDVDFTQLYRWMISNFHLLYRKRFGYGGHQWLFVYIFNALTVLILKYPEEDGADGHFTF